MEYARYPKCEEAVSAIIEVDDVNIGRKPIFMTAQDKQSNAKQHA